MSIDLLLFKAMLREEWRLHRALVGGLGSAFFPAVIFLLTASCAAFSPLILRNTPVSTLLLMLHAASLFYGVFVGGFGAVGEHVMSRRLGQVNMLLQLPMLQPVSFRRVMLVFYVKDAVYYLGYTFVPLLLGLAVAAPAAGVSFTGVLMLGVTMFASFMLGMGLSFVLSALPGRSGPAGLAASALVLGLGALVYPLGVLQPHQVLLPLGYWVDRSPGWLVASTLLSTASAAAGALVMRVSFETRERRYGETFLRADREAAFLGGLGSLVAKEWLELSRGGAMGPAVGGYTLHLAAVYFMSWLLQAGFGVPVGFNVVFFSGFVGFMGVMTYNALTGHEHNEYLNLVPVTVDRVVKAKLVVYFLLTGGVTGVYVFLIGLVKGELLMVPGGILVAACTSVYVVAVTAYLTGLWTNTLFFGAGTILRFAALVVPPLTLIEMGALLLQFRVMLGAPIIVGGCSLAVGLSVILLSRMRRRWQGATFSLVSTT